eukprot:3409055-Amphidinium_carterae.1
MESVNLGLNALPYDMEQKQQFRIVRQRRTSKDTMVSSIRKAPQLTQRQRDPRCERGMHTPIINIQAFNDWFS